MSEPAEDTFNDDFLIKEFKEKYLGLIERYYIRLYQALSGIRQGYRSHIKLLQIFDIMLGNFIDQQHESYKRELENRIFGLLLKINENDWRFLRKLCDQRNNFNLEHLSFHEDLLQGFLKKIEKVKTALLWKDEKISVKCAEEIVDSIYALYQKNRDSFVKSLIAGRFDKQVLNFEKRSVEGSLILGDEGGLYLLMNSIVPKSHAETIILESGVSIEFLHDKRNVDNKVILGKGAFGSVRLALSIFGDLNVDIGQLVCVKKSLRLGNVKNKTQNTLNNVTESSLEDFFAKKLNESIHAPKPLDMAIINSRTNEERHRKGYLIMEIVPENTADKIFRLADYQKWEYQKSYIVEVMKTMRNLLVNERVFNSDLKPQNTLFDPLTRKMAIIDLGSSLFIEKSQNIEKFDASVGGFGFTEPYCPPEILDENQIGCLNLYKALSYICGVTIAEVTSVIPQNCKKAVDKWKLGELTDLKKNDKKTLQKIVNGLLEKNPVKRLDLSEALEAIETIGSDEQGKKAIYEHYIFKARKLIENNPSTLNLNMDINEVMAKGIIEQRVATANPKRFKNKQTIHIEKEFDDFFSKESKNENKIFVLLGDAGSGKSLSLQMRFIKEVKEWNFGKPLPIYFNMADETDLERVFRRINGNLGCNIRLDADNDKLHLFIDSYDEGPSEIIKRGTKSPYKNTLIQEYIDQLKSWKTIKLLVSCRVDFVLSEGGEEDISSFKEQGKAEPSVRFIVPIGCGRSDKVNCPTCFQIMGLILKKNDIFDCIFCKTHISFQINENKFYCKNCKEKLCLDRAKSNDFSIFTHVSEWLLREGKKGSGQDLLSKIKIFALTERIKTGLMFNMIMNLLTSEVDLNAAPIGFEIYANAIDQEICQNWGKILSKKNSKKQKEQIKHLEIVMTLLGLNELQETNAAKTETEEISEGLKRIGELVATEMTRISVNRLRFAQIEDLIFKNKSSYREDSDDTRLEWKPLYQILKVMGMKLEKRSSIKPYDATVREKHSTSEDLDVGFRHETYKNYYLLRRLTRIYENKRDGKVPCSHEEDDSNIKKALLDQRSTIDNFELLRFFGEAVKNHKNSSLREGLRKELSIEQELNRLNRANDPGPGSNNKMEVQQKPLNANPRAAVIMSLLVAGEYPFQGEVLSDLDFTGANMRGGIFHAVRFERVNLNRANLRHTNLSNSKFIKADLRGSEIGVWPDIKVNVVKASAICYSPDGKKIACAADTSLKVWSSTSGEFLLEIEGHSSDVHSVSFSPDGKTLVSGSSDKSFRVWDSSSGICLKKIEAHSEEVTAIAFSPEGKRMATGSLDRTLKIWDTESWQCVKTILGAGEVTSLSFSPDGRKIASSRRDIDKYWEVRIWDPVSGKILQKMLNPGPVTSICYSRDGSKISSAGHFSHVEIWDSDNGNSLLRIEGVTDFHFVNSVSFSPDGKRLATGGDDKSIKIFDSESGECIQNISEHTNSVASVCFSPDGRSLASCSCDGTLKIWDIFGGESVQMLTGHLNPVNSVSFAQEGNRFGSACKKNIKIWDSGSGCCLKTLPVDKVNSVCFSPDGEKLASCSDDNTTRIWQISTGKCLLVFYGHLAPVYQVCFSPDGGRLVSCSASYSIRIWDITSGHCLQTLEGHRGNVNSVCFSPKGIAICSGSDDRNLIIWDSLSGKSERTLIGHSHYVRSVCYSQCGKFMASGSFDKTVRVWDASTGICLKTMTGHSSDVRSVNFNPDGIRVVSGSHDKTVKIWDIKTGDCIQTLAQHWDFVLSVCFSPDGKRLISAGSDKTIKIWRSGNGNCLHSQGHPPKNYTDPMESAEICEKCQQKFFLNRSIKGGEEPFSCAESVFEDCIIDERNERDLLFKKVITQRGGEFN